MDVIFTRIAKPTGAIQLRELNEIIAARPDLQQVPDRQLVNPFTNEPISAPGEGKAFYLEHGKLIGNLSLEDGEVITTAIPVAVCEELAMFMGAVVHHADFS